VDLSDIYIPSTGDEPVFQHHGSEQRRIGPAVGVHHSLDHRLGALTEAYRAAAGATTTITSVESDADVALYNDEGTGWGSTSSPSADRLLQHRSERRHAQLLRRPDLLPAVSDQCRHSSHSEGSPQHEPCDGRWGRLNLYAAADGYGAFDSDVTVTMDASAGGFSARDIWRNDISGSGTLIKEGTGELDLTGENTFQGGIRVNDGVIVAASPHALGKGGAMVNGGSLIDAARGEALTVEGDYTQSSGGSLELDLGHEAEGRGSGAMIVRGKLNLAGQLRIDFSGREPHAAVIPLIRFTGAQTGSFANVVISGFDGGAYSLSYDSHVVTLHLTHPRDH
jgi:autotransporter-associated beta strand protein